MATPFFDRRLFDFSPQEISEMNKARKMQEGIPLFGRIDNGYIGNFAGGAASSLLRGFADTAGFANFNNVENLLNSGANYFDERLPAPMPAEFSWKYLTSPEGWARGSGNVLGSIGSIALPSGVAALAIPKTLTKAAQGLSALSKGKIGLDTAKALIFGAGTVPMEAAMEGREVEKDALARGMSPETARDKAWGAFGRNVGILGLSNAAQWGLLPKLLGKGTSLKGRLGAGAGELIAQANEEGLQRGAYNEMVGEPYSYNPAKWFTDPQLESQKQEVTAGFLDLLPLTALGGGAGYIRDRYLKNDEQQEFDKLPAGAFEGKYWQKQHAKVSYEGAQPQTLKAIDALSKWFYEKTGAPLIVTSVTDGKSHQGGEHSHYNGWKVDVNDLGSGMEGALTTEDGKKGWLTDEFIKYGQSLGLGMNWENDHIDVAIDGTQWDGSTETKNFGGFKFSAAKTEPNEDTEENDSDFTEKQNQMWRLAQYAANRAKTKYGYEIPAELFYKQWAHESGANFDANKTLAAVHNYGGLTQIEENDLPQPDGSNYYRKFNNDTEYADAYIDDFIKRYPEINGVKTEKEFATVLKNHGYFGDTLENYTRGMEGIAVPKTKIKNPASFSTNEKDSETETEKPAETPFAVDEILKSLIWQNIQPNFKIEKDSALSRAVYKDFALSKMQDDTDEEYESNRNFFMSHPEFFDKAGNFVNSPKARAAIKENFGEDAIGDFGQKLITDRIAAVKSLQTPKDLFETKETTNKKAGIKSYIAELSEGVPKETQKELEEIAYQYGGKRGKKIGVIHFGTAEDRANFMDYTQNYIQNLQTPPAPVQENISAAQTQAPPEIQSPENPVQNISAAQTQAPPEIQLSENPAQNISAAQTQTPPKIQSSENPAQNISAAQTQAPPEIQSSENPAQNIQPSQTQTPATINFGNTAADSYKKISQFNQSQTQKFQENMSKTVTYNGETLTRQQLVEKIATGDIEESAIKTTGEKEYLNFLRDNVVAPIQAIQNAGIADESAKQEYHFQIVPYKPNESADDAPFAGMNFNVEVPTKELPALSKDSATLENLKKLAESLGGNFDNNKFTFGNNANAATTFRTAANLFTGNQHLNYLQNQSDKKSELAQEVSDSMTGKTAAERIENLYQNFKNETAQELGIDDYDKIDELDITNYEPLVLVDKKISEKLGYNSRELHNFERKLESIPIAVEEGLTTSDEAYEAARKMIYGTEEEKAAANTFYENLRKELYEKIKQQFPEKLKKITDKFPELEEEVRDDFNRTLNFIENSFLATPEYYEASEKTIAHRTIAEIKSGFYQRYGKEIYRLKNELDDLQSDEETEISVPNDEHFKLLNVSENIERVENDADNKKISYVDAYSQIKKILSDAGLEDVLGAKKRDTNAEIRKILDEHDYEKYPLSEKLKKQANEAWIKFQNEKIEPKEAIEKIRSVFDYAKKEKSAEIKVGDFDAETAYKIDMLGNERKKFDRVMNKVVLYRGEPMTQRELVEKIYQNEIPESAIKGNGTANNYLNFLQGNIPRGIEAIKKAGLVDEQSLNEGGYIQETGEKSAAFVDKADNPATVEKLVKLAKVFNGGIVINSNNKPVFEFDTPANRNSFKSAAELFLPNKHLRYFKPAPKSEEIERQSAPIETVQADTKQPKTETEQPVSKNEFENVKPFVSSEIARREMLKALGIEDRNPQNDSDDKINLEESKKSAEKFESNTESNDGKIHSKIVNFVDDSDENLEQSIAELKKELDKISANPMFNPKVYTLGLKIGAIYFQRGLNNISEWTNTMVDSVGEKIRKWLPSIQATIESLPPNAKYDENQMAYISQYLGALMQEGKITSYQEAISEFEKDVGKETTEKFEPMFQAAYVGIKKFFDILDSETKTSAKITPPEIKPSENPATINFGNIAADSYKKISQFNQSQTQKFQENMSKTVTYNGETLTRQQLVEKIATGDIEESAIKTKGEKKYLNFLRDNVVTPIQAIQNAGIATETSKQPYHFSVNYLGDMGKTIYESGVAFDEQNKFSKDTAAIEQLAKLAELLGGKLGKGQTTLGEDAFIFDENGKGAELFTNAANLFTSNEHLKYLQGKSENIQTESKDVEKSESAAISEDIAKFREWYTPTRFIGQLALFSSPENFDARRNEIAFKSSAEIGLRRRAKKILEKAKLEDKHPPFGSGESQYHYPIAEENRNKDNFSYAVNLSQRLTSNRNGEPLPSVVSALEKIAAQFDSEIDNQDIWNPTYYFKEDGDAVLFAKAVEMYFDNGNRARGLLFDGFRTDLSQKEIAKLKEFHEKLFGKQEKITDGAGVIADDKTYIWDDKNLYFRDKDTRQGVNESSGKDFALQYVYGYGDAEKAIDALNKDLNLYALTYVHESLAEAKKILQNEGKNWKANWNFKYQTSPVQSQSETATDARLKVGEFKHTKTGEMIPSAELTERVENSVYNELQKLAKKYGGSYSKFAKKFLFKKAEGRDNFVADANKDIFKTSPQQKSAETKKAAVIVTGDEFGEYADIKDLREKAINYYREELQGTSVENTTLGKIDIDENGLIEFSNSGRKKLQSSSRNEEKLLLIKHLPELLKTAFNIRNVDSHKEKHAQDSFIYMDNYAEINSEIIPIHITLIKRNNGSIQFYNHNVIETQKRAGNSARPESSDEALGTLPFSASSAENITQNAGNDNAEAAKFTVEVEGKTVTINIENDQNKEKLLEKADELASEIGIIIIQNDDKHPSYRFSNEEDAAEFAKALERYGGIKNESNELGKSGSVNEGHQILQSEIRPSADEGTGQKGSDTVSERISGQQRPTLRGIESDDIGTNAESSRSIREESTGTEGARVSAGNSVRRSESPIQPATSDAERGRIDVSRISSNDKSIEFAGHNFRITEDNNEIGSGGLKTKFKQNIAAIELLKKLELEGRLATPSEQAILAQFNGWGTLKDAFTNSEQWQKEFQQLKEILTPEEYDAAFKAITNAFYTPVDVARAMWAGLQHLGFNGGRILDPSMGSGIFFGTMPAEIAKNSSLAGVELDSLTGRIAQQLYQNANVEITGFEKRVTPPNYFDLAITNVPFNSDLPILSDPEYKTQKYKLHDFFFAKAIDKVRPGGFVAFITSPDTMSSFESQKLRAAVAEKADLIAAFKLPNTTFDKSSGTKALADILILQKRLDPLKPSKYAQEWLEDGEIYTDKRGFRVNKYFENHPEHIIGKPVESTHFYSTLDIDGKGHDVAKELSALMQKLPENIFVPVQFQPKNPSQIATPKISDSSLKNFEFTEKDGVIYQNQVAPKTRQSELVEVPKENWATVKSYLPLRKSVDNLLKAQLSPKTTDSKLKDLRQTLHKNYDNFVKNHGYLNSKQNQKILGSDPYYGRTAAIEVYTAPQKSKTENIPESAKKADIFFKRTATPDFEPAPTDSAKEAMYSTLSKTGIFDIKYIQRLTGKTEDEIIKEIGDLLYKNPATDLQELAEEYLSGNVRGKLAIAKEAAKTNPEFRRNVEALQKVQPQDLTENEIATFLGSSWIDNSYYEQFARRLNGGNTISIVRDGGKFLVLGDTNDVKRMAEWSVDDTNLTLYDFLQDALNRRVRVPKTLGKPDPIKAAGCKAIVAKLNKLFDEWIFSDEERKEYLINHFNMDLNNSVARKYDGSHLTFPDLNPEIRKKLYPHQKDAVWRIMNGKNTLLAHCVGAGKSATRS